MCSYGKKKKVGKSTTTVKELFFWQSWRQLACKFTKSELLLRYFTMILLKLEVYFFYYIFKNLITTIFKEHLSVDASESC